MSEIKTGVTQCPKCGAVGTYKITLSNGTIGLSCTKCRKSFRAEVRLSQFTGRNS